jgi:hypothetical protein
MNFCGHKQLDVTGRTIIISLSDCFQALSTWQVSF